MITASRTVGWNPNGGLLEITATTLLGSAATEVVGLDVRAEEEEERSRDEKLHGESFMVV